MASRKTLLIAAAMAIVAVAAALLPATASASAATYMVGDASGWAPGVDYGALASTTFSVGDTLVFRYTAGEHDVVRVDALSYAACATPDNAPALTSGNDRVVLRQSGQFFFISNVEGDCGSGMKLAITVQ